MGVVNTVLAFLAAIALLVVVHELGHFLAARACGVRVLRFSIGFGRPLAIWRHGADQTEWVISAIPLGGYVKMLDEREGPVAATEVASAFNRKSVWKRIAIVAAGPLANFFFAIVVYTALFVNGVPEAKPIVDAPVNGSLAASSGINRGDTVLRVNAIDIETWQDLRWKLIQLALDRKSAKLELLSVENRVSWVVLDFSAFSLEDQQRDPILDIGLQLFRPDVPPIVGGVVEGSVAQLGGLRAGDRIVKVDGVPVRTWGAVVDVIKAKPGRLTVIDIERGTEMIRTEVVPAASRVPGTSAEIGRIGAYAKPGAADTARLVSVVHHNPAKAVQLAVRKTIDTAFFSLKMFGKMLLGEISPRNLSGPISIADYAGQSAQLGMAPFFAFLALISISLGVLNLLPVPLLDGGHLLYYTIEVLRGNPLSERAMEFGQKLGLGFLVVLMAFAFYNDFSRILSG